MSSWLRASYPFLDDLNVDEGSDFIGDAHSADRLPLSFSRFHDQWPASIL